MIEVYDLKEVLKELIKAAKPKVKAAGIEIAEQKLQKKLKD